MPRASSLSPSLQVVILQVTNQSSEIADDRPSAACEFAPGGATLATGAWSGLLKLWSVPACQKKLTIKAHEDRVTGQLCMCQLPTRAAILPHSLSTRIFKRRQSMQQSCARPAACSISS